MFQDRTGGRDIHPGRVLEAIRSIFDGQRYREDADE